MWNIEADFFVTVGGVLFALVLLRRSRRLLLSLGRLLRREHRG